MGAAVSLKSFSIEGPDHGEFGEFVRYMHDWIGRVSGVKNYCRPKDLWNSIEKFLIHAVIHRPAFRFVNVVN